MDKSHPFDNVVGLNPYDVSVTPNRKMMYTNKLPQMDAVKVEAFNQAAQGALPAAVLANRSINVDDGIVITSDDPVSGNRRVMVSKHFPTGDLLSTKHYEGSKLTSLHGGGGIVVPILPPEHRCYRLAMQFGGAVVECDISPSFK
jgi:hypothetical protein